MLTCSRYACIRAGEKLRKTQEDKAVDNNKGEKPDTAKTPDTPKSVTPVSEKESQNNEQGFLKRWLKKYAG